MRQRATRLFRRLSGTAFILAATAAVLVPLLSGLPSRAATQAGGGMRSIFLNGTDISSARSQDLKNVDVHINESGDLFIVAPHYQVNEEDTYVPLSKFVEGLNGPKHKVPQAIPNEVASPKAVPGTPEPVTATAEGAAGGGMLPKAGSPSAQPVSAPSLPAAAPAPTRSESSESSESKDEPPTLPDDAVDSASAAP